MNRILASVTTLEQHFDEIANGGDVYRPANCPHCQVGGLWRHGCYHRIADRNAGSSESLNSVPVMRYLCRACWHTCSRLPLCIAPRRWYDWAMQQVILVLLLAGCSVHHCCNCTSRARSTVRRWRDWLQARSDSFTFFLRSRNPELGRFSEFGAFWQQVTSNMSLVQAMAWLDHDLIVP